MYPKKLNKGDTVAIVAPAKNIEKEAIDFSTKILEQNGYKVIISENCLNKSGYFSGTVEQRAKDLQWAIDNPDVSAVLFARGGYGCIQIIDKTYWDNFFKKPKWLIGYSDITVFHQLLAKKNIVSIHASMPLNFKDNSSLSLSTLFDALENKRIHHKWESSDKNKFGEVDGEIIGGNLSVLRSLVGTKYQPDYKNKILFVEDVGEYLYAIDRNLYQLSHSSILDQISAAVFGDFSEIKDTPVNYGASLHEIISSHFRSRNIPVAFNFPAGHCNDNRAIVFGKKYKLKVKDNKAELYTL